MGREVRRVPADWQHPKRKDGSYIPLLSRPPSGWDEGKRQWEAGLVTDYRGGWEAKTGWITHIKTWEGYAGKRPNPAHCMPDWPVERRTHWQMYEDTTEGTPISPVFETPESLARWLADTGAPAFADMTAAYDQWLAMIQNGSAVSMVLGPEGMKSGVEASVELKESR